MPERTPGPRRGAIIGQRVGGEPPDEVKHFIKCPTCGGWIDMRDLAQVMEHEGRCRIRRSTWRRWAPCWSPWSALPPSPAAREATDWSGRFVPASAIDAQKGRRAASATKPVTNDAPAADQMTRAVQS